MPSRSCVVSFKSAYVATRDTKFHLKFKLIKAVHAVIEAMHAVIEALHAVIKAVQAVIEAVRAVITGVICSTSCNVRN